MDAAYAVIDEETVQRLPDVQRPLPLLGDHASTRTQKVSTREPGALQGVRHLRGRLPERRDPGAALRRRADLRGDRGDPLMSFEPKLVGFLCNWCSYTGADLAGTARMKYPPNLRVIRVMCSGRVDPNFVLEALARGADGVLVLRVPPGRLPLRGGQLQVPAPAPAHAEAGRADGDRSPARSGWSGCPPPRGPASRRS